MNGELGIHVPVFGSQNWGICELTPTGFESTATSEEWLLGREDASDESWSEVFSDDNGLTCCDDGVFGGGGGDGVINIDSSFDSVVSRDCILYITYLFRVERQRVIHREDTRYEFPEEMAIRYMELHL